MNKSEIKPLLDEVKKQEILLLKTELMNRDCDITFKDFCPNIEYYYGGPDPLEIKQIHLQPTGDISIFVETGYEEYEITPEDLYPGAISRILDYIPETGYISLGNPDEDGNKYSVEIGMPAYVQPKRFVVNDVSGEEEALDKAVDYCEEQGWNGLFWDEKNAEEYPDDFITAGNHCHLIRRDMVVIKKL